MRPIRSAEDSAIQLADDDYLAAIAPLPRADQRPVDRTRTRPRLLDERPLIDDLWHISHYGWIPGTMIRRALTLAHGREIPTDSLHDALRQLLDHGWIELRDANADDEEHYWRLTDGGRQARVS